MAETFEEKFARLSKIAAEEVADELTGEVDVCPRCEGRKVGMAMVDRVIEGKRDGRFQAVKCPTCHGTGTLSKSRLVKIEAGKKHSERRKERQYNLHEYAGMLRITPQELNAYEHGQDVHENVLVKIKEFEN